MQGHFLRNLLMMSLAAGTFVPCALSLRPDASTGQSPDIPLSSRFVSQAIATVGTSAAMASIPTGPNLSRGPAPALTPVWRTSASVSSYSPSTGPVAAPVSAFRAPSPAHVASGGIVPGLLSPAIPSSYSLPAGAGAESSAREIPPPAERAGHEPMAIPVAPAEPSLAITSAFRPAANVAVGRASPPGKAGAAAAPVTPPEPAQRPDAVPPVYGPATGLAPVPRFQAAAPPGDSAQGAPLSAATMPAGASTAGPPLSLQEAVKRAVEWHPSVEEAIGALNGAGQRVAEERAGYSPQIRGGVGSDYRISAGSSWRPQATLSATQMIYDFGKVANSVAAAEAGVHVSRARVLVAVDDLARNTAYSVIEVQRNRALYIVAQEQLASVQAIDKLVRYRTERGASTRSDQVQSEARVQSAEATILQISAELHRWESNLRHLLGSDVPVPVADDVPAWFSSSCALGSPDWEQVPAILEFEGQREAALANYRYSKAEAMPTLSAGADVGADFRDPFSGRSEATIGLTVSSNLYQGGATRARTQGAYFALQTAEAALASTRLELSRNLMEAREQIASLTSLIRTLELRQDSMLETGKLYRLQYFEMGTRTLLEMLNAEQEYHQVRFERVNAIHDVRRLNSDCLYNSGATRDSFALTGMIVRGVTL